MLYQLIKRGCADSLQRTRARGNTPGRVGRRRHVGIGFQDITGQRIGKVVGALRQIEFKVEGLLAAFGDEDARARRDHLESELGGRQGVDGGLLNGPQGQAEAQTQDDIDALFEG